MPLNPGLDTVPLGEAGTGAAYILPQGSVAADRLLDTIDYNQKINAVNQQNRLVAAQKMAQSYKDNAFKAKNGTLYNPELMALQQKHVQQGEDYAKQGFDIYNPNPNNSSQMDAHNQYMADRAKLYDYQDVRDDLSKHLAGQDDLATKAKPGEYDPDSIQTLHDFYTKNTLRNIADNGLQAPSIQKAFDAEANVGSKLQPVMSPETEYVTKSGHKITTKQFMPKETASLVSTMFQQAPGGADFLQKKTGLTPDQAKVIPDSLSDITKLNDSAFRSTDAGRQALVKAGITSYSDPKYQQLLQQKSQQDFIGKQKYNGIIQSYVDRQRAKAQQINKDVPDFTYEDQRFKRNAEARAQANFDDKDKEGQVTFGNQASQVPVLKTTVSGGKTVPQVIGYDSDNNPITANSTVENEKGATLFSQNFPQTKVTATPGNLIDLKSGHSIKNSQPIEATVGSVRMEPTFTGLGEKDSRNGAVISKRQLEETFEGKGNFKIQNINFSPIVYGERPVKDAKGKINYQPVAFHYDAVRGNEKIKTTNFDKVEQQFREFINSDTYKAMSTEQRHQYFLSQFNIK